MKNFETSMFIPMNITLNTNRKIDTKEFFEEKNKLIEKFLKDRKFSNDHIIKTIKEFKTKSKKLDDFLFFKIEQNKNYRKRDFGQILLNITESYLTNYKFLLKELEIENSSEIIIKIEIENYMVLANILEKMESLKKLKEEQKICFPVKNQLHDEIEDIRKGKKLIKMFRLYCDYIIIIKKLGLVQDLTFVPHPF
jgi:hypothetical protein